MDDVAVRPEAGPTAPAAAPASTSRSGPLAVAGVALAWLVTIVSLVILDDMVFGPVFWAIGALWGPLVSTAIAFLVYFPVQIWLVRRGTSAHPRRLAAFMLRRLGLDHSGGWSRPREHAVRSRILGGGSAVALSPVVGGVIPPMLLWRQGFGATFVRRLSVVTAAVYAGEFALLHGWIAGNVVR